MNKTQAENVFQNALRHHKAGKSKEAERQYRDILKAFPDLAVVRSNLAAALLSQGKREESLHEAERVLAANPGDHDALSNKGAALSALDRMPEAIETYALLSLLAPNDPVAQFNLGVAKGKQGDLDGALVHYKKAVALNRDFIEAWLNQGHLLALRGKNRAAEDAFRQVLRMDPEHAGALSNLGNALMAMGRIEEALENYDFALQAEPSNILALQGRANLFLAIGDPDSAQHDVDLALDISPETAELMVLRGNVCHDLEWNTEAIDAYKRALELKPDLPGIADLVAKLSASHIPLWHYTMLADHGRNTAYREAIEKAVKPGMHVLDIGTGTGLLSMMAVRAGAELVTAVESGREMSAVAKRVVERNGFSDKINVMRIHSLRLQVGRHLPRPVDMIVSEIVDAGLLGEGVLPSLRHAWVSLADKNATMLPAGATVEGILANLPIKSLENVEGFDLSELSVHHFPGKMRNIKMIKEPHEPLSAPFQVTNFDFTSIPDEVPDESPIWWEREVTASADGIANVVMIWFVLHLDSEISVNSGPEGTMDHWGQMAFFLPKALTLRAGEQVKLKVGRTDRRWWFAVVE